MPMRRIEIRKQDKAAFSL